MQKEQKMILCWILIFTFILSSIQPIKTNAFGYKDKSNDVITLESGDILRKGVTYKVNKFKYDKYNWNTSSEEEKELDVEPGLSFILCLYSRYTEYNGNYSYEFPSWNEDLAKTEILDVKSNNEDDYIEITPIDNNYVFSLAEYDTSYMNSPSIYFYEIPDTNLIDSLQVGMVLKGGETYGFVWDDAIEKTNYNPNPNYGSYRPSLITFEDGTKRNISLFSEGTGIYSPYSTIYVDNKKLEKVGGANITSYLFSYDKDIDYKDLDGSTKTLHKYGDNAKINWEDSSFRIFPALTIITLPEEYDWKYVKNPEGNTYYFESVEKKSYPSLTINIKDKDGNIIVEPITMGAISLNDNKLETLTPDTYEIGVDGNKVGTLQVSENDSKLETTYKDVEPKGIYCLDNLDTSDDKNFVLNLKANYTNMTTKVKDKNNDIIKDVEVSLDDIKLDNVDGIHTKNKVIDKSYNVKINDSLIGVLDLENNTFTNATPNGDYVLDTINIVNGKAQVDFKQVTKTINVYDNYSDKGKTLRGSYKFAKGESYSFDSLENNNYVVDGTKNYKGVVDNFDTLDIVFNYKVKSVDPIKPSEPSEPITPSKPSTPSTPNEPTKPSEPSTPVKPSEPTNPVIPIQPNEPTKPSVITGPGIESNDNNQNEPLVKNIKIKVYDKYDGIKHFREEITTKESNKNISINALTLKDYIAKESSIVVKSNKNQEVIFEYNKVEQKDNTPSNENKDNATPQTSDNSPLYQNTIMMIVALLSMLGLCIIFRKNKKRKE